MSEKILIVDDDLDTLRLVGQMLETQGYQIQAASTGTQALAKARHEFPDLVLLDIMMPDIDGIEVIKQIRSDPATRLLPVIFFTAKNQLDDKVQGFDAGADDYMTKPVHPRELVARVRAVLSRTYKTHPGGPPTGKAHVVGVMAAKGGVGSSTIALNLAVALGRHIQGGVIAAEFRPGYGAWGLDLGYLKPSGLRGLAQFSPKKLTIETIEKDLVDGLPGVKLLMASYNPAEYEIVSATPILEAALERLTHLSSVVIVEFGTNVFPDPEKLITQCDEIMVVLDPQPTSVARTKALLDDLAHKGFGKAKPVNIILNQRFRTEAQLSWSQVQDALNTPLAAVMTPTPELAYQAALHCTPMLLLNEDGQNTNAQQYVRLAESVILQTRKS